MICRTKQRTNHFGAHLSDDDIASGCWPETCCRRGSAKSRVFSNECGDAVEFESELLVMGDGPESGRTFRSLGLSPIDLTTPARKSFY